MPSNDEKKGKILHKKSGKYVSRSSSTGRRILKERKAHKRVSDSKRDWSKASKKKKKTVTRGAGTTVIECKGNKCVIKKTPTPKKKTPKKKTPKKKKSKEVIILKCNEKCKKGYILNPASGKCVKKTGRLGMAISATKCKPDQVINPANGNCVKKTGKIGIAIMKKRCGVKKPKKTQKKTQKKTEREEIINDVLTAIALNDSSPNLNRNLAFLDLSSDSDDSDSLFNVFR